MKSSIFAEGIFGKDDELALENAWNVLRWTKRVAQAICIVEVNGSKSESPPGVLADPAAFGRGPTRRGSTTITESLRITPPGPKQRITQHVKAYTAVNKAIDGQIKQMRKRAEHIQKLLRESPEGNLDTSAPAA